MGGSEPDRPRGRVPRVEAGGRPGRANERGGPGRKGGPQVRAPPWAGEKGEGRGAARALMTVDSARWSWPGRARL
jgi:hypothetical protein